MVLVATKHIITTDIIIIIMRKSIVVVLNEWHTHVRREENCKTADNGDGERERNVRSPTTGQYLFFFFFVRCTIPTTCHMDYGEARRQRQLLGFSILSNLALRFLLIALASVTLIKLVSVLLARSSELHALELLSAANSYLDRHGGGNSDGGDR